MPSRIGALAARHGLSRSTLLYYDRIGLLKPSSRRPNGYREYTARDEERLGRIVTLRRTGASMREIAGMLEGGKGTVRAALERQVERLNEEIQALRERQRFILRLLKSRKIASRVGVMNLDLWVTLLRSSGFDEEAMNRWHAAFERSSPERHREFLEFLCLPERDIERIRRASRGHAAR